MRPALACLLFLLSAALARADYPRIQRLGPEDELFRQLQTDLSEYYRAVNRGLPALPGAGRRSLPAGKAPTDKSPADKAPDGGATGTAPVGGAAASELQLPPLRFFSLARPETMDLFALAARLNLPYATLATLNGASGPSRFSELEDLVAPNLPGLFVPDKPQSSFEEILCSITANTAARRNPQPVVVRLPGGNRRFSFYPGEDFTAVERAFFLNILFRFPLALRELTSAYGPRLNPLTGSPEYHQGVDLAAPVGTQVMAARDGVVEQVGSDPVLGNVVVVGHEGGYQTVYGHLRVILVALNQGVRSGMIIGEVGSTGRSTGAHLHFEVRRKGSSRDPLPLLPPEKAE
jgi:murein DD-endopeptidase MepM/ murein hydrolase activator NlpD